MISSFILPTGRPAARIAVSAIAIAIAVAGARVAVSFGLARSNPELAYRIDSGNAEAIAALADARMFAAKGPADAARVRTLAIDALRYSPLAPQALRNIGFVDAVERGEARAEPVLRVAGRASLRDFLVHVWLFDWNYRRNAVAQAVREADVVLSQAQDRWDTIMPMVIRLMADPRTIAPLAEALARQPAWRGTFLERMGFDSAIPDPKYALLTALKRRGSPASVEELRGYMLTAAKTQPPRTLRARWLALVPKPTSARGGINDGSFDGVDLPPPYIWTFYPVGETYAERQVREDGQGNALYASFEGTDRATFVSQLLALTPGRYRLGGLMLAEENTRPGQFRWVVHCGSVGQRTATLGEYPLATRGDRWISFGAEFDVPADCPAQDLELAAMPNENGKIATLWVDSVTVTPVALPR